MVEIRRLESEDRDNWEQLFRAYMDFYEESHPQEVYDRAWGRFQEDEQIHARGAWVDRQLVGIVHFVRHAHTNAPDVCYLQDLFTAPEARGQGIARRLIEYVTEWAREQGCSSVYWQTHVSNVRARRLYDLVAEHRGFIVYEVSL